LADYLVNNVEKILSLTLSYDNLFDESDKKYYNIFINLKSEEKYILLKFLRRNNKWQNIYKIFDKDENNINVQEIIFSLLEKKLISNFEEIIGDFKNINNNKLFEYLYYLSNDDIQKINNELNNICKNLNSSKDKESFRLSPYVNECFINNP
jgi:methyl-accepting chemotaxis protein